MSLSTTGLTGLVAGAVQQGASAAGDISNRTVAAQRPTGGVGLVPDGVSAGVGSNDMAALISQLKALRDPLSGDQLPSESNVSVQGFQNLFDGM